MSDSTLEFMTRWDGSPGIFIGLMAISVLCLWLSLRYVFRDLKRRRRWWRRLSNVLLPVVIALLILSEYLVYLVWTYRFILARSYLW